MKRIIILVSLFLSTYSLLADDLTPIPELKQSVIDLTYTLNNDYKEYLLNSLQEIEQETGNQIVVLIISTTGKETIEEYSNRVAQKWRIGKRAYPDGIIIVIAKNDRKIRIEIGAGIKDKIPNEIANRIIEEKMIPEFKDGRYYAGINAAIFQLKYLIKGYPSIADTMSKRTKKGILKYFIFSFLSSIVVVIIIIAVKNKKTRGIIIVILSIISALVGIGFFFSYISALFPIFTTVFIIVGIGFLLFLGGKVMSRNNYKSSSKTRSSGSYSSNSNSSFSGRGGSFGGGGASGSW